MDITYFVSQAIFWFSGFFLLFRIPRCTSSHRGSTERRPSVSVIIPARNEADSLPVLLASLRNGDSVPNEIIVVVGQCEDATKEVAKREGVTIIDSEALLKAGSGSPGRAIKAPGWQRGICSFSWTQTHVLRKVA